jgi:hypothetical protein
VEAGEEVAMRDLICPPYSLSVERSMAVATQPEGQRVDKVRMNLGEVNYTLARYMPHAEVESAFGVSDLPRSWSVAPNQPPPCDKSVFGYWIIFGIAMFLIFLAAGMVSNQADPWLLVWGLFLVSIVPLAALVLNFFTDINRWSDSEFNPYSSE